MIGIDIISNGTNPQYMSPDVVNWEDCRYPFQNIYCIFNRRKMLKKPKLRTILHNRPFLTAHISQNASLVGNTAGRSGDIRSHKIDMVHHSAASIIVSFKSVKHKHECSWSGKQTSLELGRRSLKLRSHLFCARHVFLGSTHKCLEDVNLFGSARMGTWVESVRNSEL